MHTVSSCINLLEKDAGKVPFYSLLVDSHLAFVANQSMHDHRYYIVCRRFSSPALLLFRRPETILSSAFHLFLQVCRRIPVLAAFDKSLKSEKDNVVHGYAASNWRTEAGGRGPTTYTTYEL